MAKSRASKGFLVEPVKTENLSSERRNAWIESSCRGFVTSSPANREYYRVLLEALWPMGHGIPGPILSQGDLREAIDRYRSEQGKGGYRDVFRRVRELQGEEGFTSIVKEGVNYQLQSLAVGPKREPRAKPNPKLWQKIRETHDYRCAHCGAQEPDARLSPDHRMPRSRGGH